MSDAPRFLSRLDLLQLGRRKWILHAPLAYESPLIGRLVVPAEFITDLASVPRLPLAFLIAGDRARGPAVLHDWLYQHPDFEDRALADAVIYEAAGVHQPELGFEAEPEAIRSAIWSGVRAGGWWAWRQHGKRAEVLNPEWTSAGWPDVLVQGA